MASGVISTALLMGFMGGWEVVLILAIILALYGSRSLPNLLNGLSQGLDRFLEECRKAGREVTEELHATPDPSDPTRDRTPNDNLFLWIAQGFDVGRIPAAPGTFGTLVGLLWFAILLVPASPILFVVGTVFGLAASIWLCGEAERILGQRDPGSVVLDEIAAMPVCFLPWVAIEYLRHQSMPPVETFFTGQGLLFTAILFVLFRIFDIAKPWPIRKSQLLPGGLGVTVDDLLAAIYVGAISLLYVI
jgi:phosphatidylglycerophosphatase A